MDGAKAELMRALGRLVRGLSVLFWALPAAVVVDVETARTDWLRFLGNAAILPPMLAGAALYYALHQMRDFQKQERVWHHVLNQAEALAVVNAGLGPFLYWWRRFPEDHLYASCWVAVLALCFLLLLIQINQALRRLCAMLPDEALRHESSLFTTLNITLFSFSFAVLAICLGLARVHHLPSGLINIATGDNPRGLWLVLFLNLLPLALTLAILWRIKEVLYFSIFESD